MTDPRELAARIRVMPAFRRGGGPAIPDALRTEIIAALESGADAIEALEDIEKMCNESLYAVRMVPRLTKGNVHAAFNVIYRRVLQAKRHAAAAEGSKEDA